jgi:hypothetical protein
MKNNYIIRNLFPNFAALFFCLLRSRIATTGVCRDENANLNEIFYEGESPLL